MMHDVKIKNIIIMVLILCLVFVLGGCKKSLENELAGKNKQTLNSDLDSMEISLNESPFEKDLINEKSDSVNLEDTDNNYKLEILTQEQYHSEEYNHLNGYKVDVPCVNDMVDIDLEIKINNTLQYASLSWIKEKALNGLPNNISVYYNSMRYICVLNFLPNRLGDKFFFEWGVWDFITLDMLTGERVFLSDLVEVNDDFIQQLKTERIAQAENIEISFNNESLWEWLLEMTIDELKERLDECSKTQQEVIDEGYDSINETLGPIIFRNNFYIEPGKLILWFGGMDKKLIIDLNDIQDYLKVDKW